MHHGVAAVGHKGLGGDGVPGVEMGDLGVNDGVKPLEFGEAHHAGVLLQQLDGEEARGDVEMVTTPSTQTPDP